MSTHASLKSAVHVPAGTMVSHRDDNCLFQGVRYTALQGEVDPLRIREILNRFFGARTS